MKLPSSAILRFIVNKRRGNLYKLTYPVCGLSHCLASG